MTCRCPNPEVASRSGAAYCAKCGDGLPWAKGGRVASSVMISGKPSDFTKLRSANYGLPLGLKYDKANQTVSGTPRECGKFVFMFPWGEHVINMNITVMPGKSPCGWAGIPPLSPGAVISARAKGLSANYQAPK